MIRSASPRRESSIPMAAARIPPVIRSSERPGSHTLLTGAVKACLGTPSELEGNAMLRLALFILEESELYGRTELGTSEHKSRGAEQQIAEFISLHYAEEHTAKELAAMCYLSESQLRRRFVCAYGMPPIAYRNALRCRIAEELLSTTGMTVAEISARLIANKSGYRFKRAEIDQIVSHLEENLREK